MKKASDLMIGNLLTAMVVLIFSSNISAFTQQTIPAGLPSGLPNEIKGKYRIIEHDAYKKHWIVYDVNSWKKQKEKLGGVELSEEEIKMYPPIYSYEFQNGKWSHQVYKEPITNIYMSHLVTIIKADSPLKQPAKEGKQMSAEKAKNIIWSKIKYKDYWKIHTFKYENGILLCGHNSALPAAIAVWWCKGNKIYNVNGAARNISDDFELTDQVDLSRALDKRAQ